MSPLTVLKVGAALIAAFFAVEAVRTRVSEPALQGPTLAQQVQSQSPQQTPATEAAFAFKGFTLRPLARLTVQAKVLRREDYYLGMEADLSPLDLALGWQRMADPAVFERLNISQGRRWYFYSWRDQPPIPVPEIVASSANMHLIPANAAVERALRKVRGGEFVRLRGLLVEATHPSGWRWTSSLSRTDSGADSCELLYVEAVQVE